MQGTERLRRLLFAFRNFQPCVRQSFTHGRMSQGIDDSSGAPVNSAEQVAVHAAARELHHGPRPLGHLCHRCPGEPVSPGGESCRGVSIERAPRQHAVAPEIGNRDARYGLVAGARGSWSASNSNGTAEFASLREASSSAWFFSIVMSVPAVEKAESSAGESN